jgi:acyl-CoA synthetase (AMP-forming)/AMP-acid ligase II
MKLSHVINQTAIRKPDKLATIFQDRKKTYKELLERVKKLAGGLQRLGLQDGDRVAMLSHNSDRFYEMVYGISWSGGVMVPMNTRWSVAENLYALEDSTPRILLVDELLVDHIAKIKEQSDVVQTYIYCGDRATPEGMLGYEDIIEQADCVASSKRCDNDLAGIYYTGGTTGFPKGVMLSHSNLIHAAYYGLQTVDNIAGLESYLHSAPMFHLADLGRTVSFTMKGLTHVMISAFTPEAMLQACTEHQVTSVMLVPTMIQRVLSHEGFDQYDLSTLKHITYGASPITEDLLRSLLKTLPNVKLSQGYGQTEMSPGVSYLLPEDHCLDGPKAHLLRSVGLPSFGVEVKIVDDQLKEVPTGDVGQIITKGANAMLGYWNKPEETAATLVDGWILSGDMGYQDKDGYIYLMDRVKDMIITGGENVFSVEVENIISNHTAVESVAVVGIPCKKWGEAVHAIVIPEQKNNVTEQEIIEHCRNYIAGYKCPKSVEFRYEPFPLSGANKILKRDLRQPYWEGKETMIK